MDRGVFFSKARAGLLGPTLTQSEVDGCNAILDAMAGAPLAHCAYALGTAYKETAHTMQPIKEFGGDTYFFRRYDPQGQCPSIAAALGNTQPGDGVKYCGRGYPQMTGRKNYARASAELGVDLIGHPELAMAPTIAARVMRRGMDEGWFTGRSFSTYLPPVSPGNLQSFTAARRIINGQDCADEIARYALEFQGYLTAAGWPVRG